MPDDAARTPLLALTPFLWTLGEDAGMPSAYRTLTGLAANGFDVHVVLPERGGGGSRLYRDLWLHTFPLPTFGLTGDFGPTRSPLLLESPPGYIAGLRWKAFLAAMLGAAVRRGLRLRREVDPVLVYGILPTGALAAAAVAWRAGIPNVTRLFGTHLAGVQGAALAGHFWEVAAFKVPARLLLMTNDGTQGDTVARRLNVPPDRVRFLMNGVDERFLARDGLRDAAEIRAGLGLDSRTSLFLFAHHLLESHHPLTLVRAVERLIGNGRDVAAVIVGDGPQRHAVEETVRHAGLGKNVLLLGNVRRERVRELLAAADALISLDELSNLVNSVLEALASGVPVVATATGGTTDLLRHGENALLIAEAGEERLAEALALLLDDGELAARLRVGAAATARHRLASWDDRMKQEAEMLRELISS